MKIAYFHYLYDVKGSSVGAAVHVREIAKALRKLGHQVNVYGLNRFVTPEEAVKSKIRGFLKRKLSRYFGQINALLANWRYFAKEWGIIKQSRPDVILMRYNLLNFSLAIIAFWKKIPFVVEVNAPMAYESRRFHNNVLRLPLFPELLERLNLRLADSIVVVSRELQNFYMKRWNIPRERIFVVPNGVDETRFYPGLSPDKVLSKYNLRGKIVLGFIGSFHYWHGVYNLFEFLRWTLNQYKDVVFLLVGAGPLKDKVENLVKTNNMDSKVIFLGYVPYGEVPHYLAAMDIVLAPYPKLDFFYYSPLKIFEYMSAGKAVVATRIGQIAEVIRDGVNGMLFEPDDLQEMRRKTTLLIENKKLREQIGLNARRRIVEGYTWDKAAAKVSTVLEISARLRKGL